MKERRKSLAKMLTLQDQLHRLSTWKLAALDRERISLEETQVATIEAIDRAAVSNGILVAGATRRQRSIDRQIATNKAEHVTQSQLALEQGARAKLVERMVDNVEAQFRSKQERSELGDLIDRAVARKNASPA